MKTMLTLDIIIPVFNEIRTLSRLVERVSSYNNIFLQIKIIFVESNSNDGSREFLEDFQKKILKNNTYKKKFSFIFQEKAFGKGNAVREGLDNSDADIILIQDADLEYDIGSYDLLLSPFLNDNEVELVIGKRNSMRNFGNFGLRSTYLNFGQLFFHSFFRFLYNVNIQDPTTMFKIFKRTSILGLKFESNRFDFDWELICKLCRRSVKYKEIEVPYKSRGFEEGKKVGIFLDPFVWLYKIIKYRIVKL
jgi:glycosyltransferase involved in cell wall biosynthesis